MPTPIYIHLYISNCLRPTRHRAWNCGRKDVGRGAGGRSFARSWGVPAGASFFLAGANDLTDDPKQCEVLAAPGDCPRRVGRKKTTGNSKEKRPENGEKRPRRGSRTPLGGSREPRAPPPGVSREPRGLRTTKKLQKVSSRTPPRGPWKSHFRSPRRPNAAKGAPGGPFQARRGPESEKCWFRDTPGPAGSWFSHRKSLVPEGGPGPPKASKMGSKSGCFGARWHHVGAIWAQYAPQWAKKWAFKKRSKKGAAGNLR